MITVIEGGYIVEKTKVKDIYKLIGLIVINDNLDCMRVTLDSYIKAVNSPNKGVIIKTIDSQSSVIKNFWDYKYEYYILKGDKISYIDSYFGCALSERLSGVKKDFIESYHLVYLNSNKDRLGLIEVTLGVYLGYKEIIKPKYFSAYFRRPIELGYLYYVVSYNKVKLELVPRYLDNNNSYILRDYPRLCTYLKKTDDSFYPEVDVWCKSILVDSDVEVGEVNGAFININDIYCLNHNVMDKHNEVLMLPSKCKYFTGIGGLTNKIDINSLVINKEFSGYIPLDSGFRFIDSFSNIYVSKEISEASVVVIVAGLFTFKSKLIIDKVLKDIKKCKGKRSILDILSDAIEPWVVGKIKISYY